MGSEFDFNAASAAFCIRVFFARAAVAAVLWSMVALRAEGVREADGFVSMFGRSWLLTTFLM